MFFRKTVDRVLDLIPPLFVYTFVVWLIVSMYTSSMNPVTQLAYLAKDVTCKIEGGLDWEAGEKGCYRKSSNGIWYTFKKAFGG